jgi:DUF1680 family protein
MKNLFATFLLAFTCNVLLAGKNGDTTVNYIIQNKVTDKFQATSYVKLTGLLNEHVMINMEKRLLNIDSAILLSGFVHRPGSQSWIGEHMGKFLFSASNSYRYTGDKRMKALMDEMVNKYVATQLPDGYLGTYMPGNYWKSWDVWAHKYAIIGLLSYYSVTGDKSKLEVAKKAADLICKTFGEDAGQLDLNKAGYQSGMASASILEPMIDLYRYTGDIKYLDFSKYILRVIETETGAKIISTLQQTGTVTKIANAKAYEMLSCFVGMLKYYRLTGDESFLNPIKIAWNDIVSKRLYVTGTASSDEIFKTDNFLPADSLSQMGEGCVTTTWIQFNEQLFKITGEQKYINEIEKTVYNHLLAAQSPVTGCVSFYTLLQGPKIYKCNDGQSCCLSSISRGVSMIPAFVFGKINGHFSVLMYEPGIANENVQAGDGAIVELQVKANTDFPITGIIKYNIKASSNKKLTIQFRIPNWAKGFTLIVNGVKQTGSINNQFFAVERGWGKNDTVVVSFTMPLQIFDGAPTYAGTIGFKRGPQVLSLDAALNPGLTLLDSTNFKLSRQANYTLTNDSKLLPGGWIGKQAYRLNTNQTATGKSFVLVPYADAGQQTTIQKVWIPSGTN